MLEVPKYETISTLNFDLSIFDKIHNFQISITIMDKTVNTKFEKKSWQKNNQGLLEDFWPDKPRQNISIMIRGKAVSKYSGQSKIGKRRQ